MKIFYVFPDMTKIVNFWSKNADVSRTLRVRHVSYIIFGSYLGRSDCAKFRNCGICVTDYR